MEDNKMQEEVGKVVDALSMFTQFAGSKLDEVVKNAPPEEREALKKKVDAIKNGELKDVKDKFKEVDEIFSKIK